jgi:hypothetical protein
MSAFIVSRAHIDALVTAAVFGVAECDLSNGFQSPYFQGRRLETAKVHALGNCLWHENHVSVWHRYPGDARHECHYVYPTKNGRFAVPQLLPVVTVLKQIQCYEYQSCEHDGWETSDARKFCLDLTSRLISYLPGYEAAPWGVD